MAGIDDLIAQGPGRRDFSPLSELFGAYREGVKGRREDDLAQARRSLGSFIGVDGQPDYGAASLHLLRGGDIAGATALARLAWTTNGRRRAAQSSVPAGYSDQTYSDHGTGGDGATAGYAPVGSTTGVSTALPSATAPFPLPRLKTRDEVEDALAQARAARAEGRDPTLILKRLHQLGIGISNY
jgi:hypothetical protein